MLSVQEEVKGICMLLEGKTIKAEILAMQETLAEPFCVAPTYWQ